MAEYADIIIDISLSKLDQEFQYGVPPELQGALEPGDVVEVPFGNADRLTRGYVLRLTPSPSFPPEKVKMIRRRVTEIGNAQSKLTALALWMRDYYGSTTVQALRTVLPFRSKAPEKKKKYVVLAVSMQEAQDQLSVFRKKHYTARARLLEALIEEPVLPQEAVTGSLRITGKVLRSLEEPGLIRLESEQTYRTPALLEQLREQARAQAPEGTGTESALFSEDSSAGFRLTQEQQRTVDTICANWGSCSEYLIHGVTGSGKTAVYMELIAKALEEGQQAILLIPEISLTYQNVVRFYHVFGDRISILHSRLSSSERYDQFERAKSGEIDVMIGPRSALFTPFEHLGIIIIDEEHEPSYKSETTPRYDAREVARKRAALEHADLVLGSATPSLESYHAAMQGSSRLLKLRERPAGRSLPRIITVDMRRELREGNHSILSRTLSEKIGACLDAGLQSMLFINRRGYAGFVSCRSCGYVAKCPHCDVSLSLHKDGRLVCHYCGYQHPAFPVCPSCGSRYIGGFKAGTEQIESIVAEAFPQARILRMDADTTRGRDGHAEILRAFRNHEADILIGTQMIVKGHDFPEVALVGALAADLSLNVGDYQAAERTFQLLVQAAGRAGRGNVPGEMVIQTYLPEHYAITSAAEQAYEPFYRQEMQFRELSGYPPAGCLLTVHCACRDPAYLEKAVGYLAGYAQKLAEKYQAVVMGPSDEQIAKIRDVYRKALYIRHRDSRSLTVIKNYLEQYIEMNSGFHGIKINFER